MLAVFHKSTQCHVDIVFSELGPVITSHLGLGGFGIGVVNRHIDVPDSVNVER
ncbi:hypothetical protein QS430_09220 [Staphylococcus pseudintermedius]|nr:hypothetical protein QS430_09220 [Staphylococcus pseudintermedius]